MAAPWLPADTPALERRIILGALDWIGCCEEPLGSNTGPEVDAWNRAARVPVGSYWCASFVTAVWAEAGAAVPRDMPARVASWKTWAERHALWRVRPSLGAAVVYGNAVRANHIGIVVRVQPQALSVEGNTTVEGSAFEPNGTTVAMKRLTERDPILGYIVPRALADLQVVT